MKRIASLMLAAALFATGCSTAHPTAENRMGTLEADVAATPPQIIKAAETVLQGMGLKLVSSESTEIDGKVVARSALDREISISVEKEETGDSEVRIRHGWFGDEDVSVTVLERIEKELRVNKETPEK